MKEIFQKAHELGLGAAKDMDKIELIRTIQAKEGNFPCFGSAHEGVCDQFSCFWREDCLKDSPTLK